MLAEWGMTAMVTSRLARIIEEAYAQDALLDATRLCLLVPLSIPAIRDRLRPLWEQGATLPIAGMPRAVRDGFRDLRGALAIERYLQGEDVTRIRRDLLASYPLWMRWWRGFRLTVQAEERPAGEVARQVGQPGELVAAWQKLWARWQGQPGSAERLAAVAPAGEPEASAWPAVASQPFYHLLLRRHHYTPAAAEQFLFDLQALAGRLNQQARTGGQVLYFGVASDEPPGRPLASSRLLPVVLDYLIPEDWGRVSRDRSSDLKWERLQRLATGAYAQGVDLSLPDLSFLLGLSTDAIQHCLSEQSQVLLPTRGRVADMGPTLSHAEQIISLYMDGYTETEIKRRTGHSYESIERYLLDFDRVAVLVETGMPVPAIRQAVARSRRVVELETEHGCRPAQAEGLVQQAAQLYQWCCPRSDQLQPGQLVWLAHGTRRSRRTDPRLFVPVVLSLLTPAELEVQLRHRGQLKALRMAQIERLTTEAWRQDGVLTALDLEWLLHASTGLIRELLEVYQEQFGVLHRAGHGPDPDAQGHRRQALLADEKI